MIASVAAAAQSRLGGGGTDLLVTCDGVSETNACYSGRQSVQEYNRAKLRGDISYSEDQQPLQTVAVSATRKRDYSITDGFWNGLGCFTGSNVRFWV